MGQQQCLHSRRVLGEAFGLRSRDGLGQRLEVRELLERQVVALVRDEHSPEQPSALRRHPGQINRGELLVADAGLAGLDAGRSALGVLGLRLCRADVLGQAVEIAPERVVVRRSSVRLVLVVDPVGHGAAPLGVIVVLPLSLRPDGQGWARGARGEGQPGRRADPRACQRRLQDVLGLRRDCEPDPAFGSDQHGARIAFVCPLSTVSRAWSTGSPTFDRSRLL